MIGDNVQKILSEIADGNAFGEKITLVAATKTRTAEEINEAIAAGIADIGENRVQEFVEKYDAVHSAKRHFIGHLQTNKVKYLIGKCDLLHSLDRFELCDELQKRAEKANWTAECLVEINIGSELSKSGFSFEDARAAFEKIRAQYKNIRLRGLMAIPPISSSPGANRRYFAEMHQLFIDITQKMSDNQGVMDCLSMGMSADYEDAIAEGATLVRVGTALFGPRPPMGPR